MLRAFLSPMLQRLLLSLAVISLSASIASAQEGKPVTIALFGDSTVMNYDGGEKVMYGWGHFLPEALGPGYKVTNYAKGGRSTKSFWSYVEPALKTHPDIVVVQFGHNDQPGKGPDRETDPATTYREWLRKYAAAIRAAGARPIFVTSVVRRNFAGGKVNNTLRPYAEAMLAVAQEENIPCFDLNAASDEMFTKLGAEESKTFNAAPTDFTHFNEAGAKQITALVADYLKKTVPQVMAAPTPAPAN